MIKFITTSYPPGGSLSYELWNKRVIMIGVSYMENPVALTIFRRNKLTKESLSWKFHA